MDSTKTGNITSSQEKILECTFRRTAASQMWKWAWDISARQRVTHQDLASSFQHENHSKWKTPLSQQTGNLSWPRTSFIYKQRVRVPPSSTSRGRWPILTLRIAKAQVCFLLNSETVTLGFLSVSDDHNRARIWSVQVKGKTEFWSCKGSHLKFANHMNC